LTTLGAISKWIEDKENNCVLKPSVKDQDKLPIVKKAEEVLMK